MEGPNKRGSFGTLGKNQISREFEISKWGGGGVRNFDKIKRKGLIECCNLNVVYNDKKIRNMH